MLWYVREGRQRSCYVREDLAWGGKGLVMVRERGEAKVLLWYVRIWHGEAKVLLWYVREIWHGEAKVLLWYVREGRQRSCYGT